MLKFTPRFSCAVLLVGMLVGVGARDAAPSAKSGAVDLSSLPPPSRAVIPKLSGELTIDGQLNESVWRRAVVLGPFVPANGVDRAREKTFVRVWYDDKALYLGWTCHDTDIRATFTARDSKFWEEEVAEFFITSGNLARYHELQWNPLGGVFDAIIDNDLDARGVSRKITGHWDFTATGMRSAVTLKGTVNDATDRDELWQVEVVIPFADLGEKTPRPGDVWRANLYRFNRAMELPPESLSWTPPMTATFHQPARFGYIEFGK